MYKEIEKQKRKVRKEMEGKAKEKWIMWKCVILSTIVAVVYIDTKHELVTSKYEL
jgi:hypothetical protein